jgi:rhamnulokinase
VGTPDRAFVSTGTWVIVGVELDEPVTTEAARAANFSNERAVDGHIRFLKNVTGLWLLEQCRAAWGAIPTRLPDGSGPVVDPDAFAGVADVPTAIARAAGIDASDRGAIVRCIYESIAAAVHGVLDQVGLVTGTAVSSFDVFGGGVHNPQFLERLSAAAGRSCTIGPAEATALGNARTQLGGACSDTTGM